MSREMEPYKPGEIVDDSDNGWIKSSIVSGGGFVAGGAAGAVLSFLPFMGTFATIAFGVSGLSLLVFLMSILYGFMRINKKKP